MNSIKQNDDTRFLLDTEGINKILSLNYKYYSHCTSILLSTTSDVLTELLAVQLYDPDLFLCILEILNVGPLWIMVLGRSVLYHCHVILELGLAAVTLHSNIAACPSVTLYGLKVLDVTSGLSTIDMLASICISIHYILKLLMLYPWKRTDVNSKIDLYILLT